MELYREAIHELTDKINPLFLEEVYLFILSLYIHR